MHNNHKIIHNRYLNLPHCLIKMKPDFKYNDKQNYIEMLQSEYK